MEAGICACRPTSSVTIFLSRTRCARSSAACWPTPAGPGFPATIISTSRSRPRRPGVVVPPAIKARFPDEMSIILQHEFWDLVVTQDAFEVSLNFSRKPERLTVPFDAITGFTDPSVPFGFKLEPRVPEEPSAPSRRRAFAPRRSQVRPPAPAASAARAGAGRRASPAAAPEKEPSGRRRPRSCRSTRSARNSADADRRRPDDGRSRQSAPGAQTSATRSATTPPRPQNRAASGMTKAERRKIEAERKKAERDLDAHPARPPR